MLSVLSIVCTALALPVEQSVIDTDYSDFTPLRLIETAPNVTKWLNFEEILNLKRENINFMDITDHAVQFEMAPHHTNASFPTEIAQRKAFAKISADLSKAELELKLSKFTSFFTRYAKSDSGLESSLWLYETVKELAEDREDITVNLFDHEWEQKSLILSINGTKNPEKVVVVGAHQDSINLLMPSMLPSPGADDDGSGSMTALEVLRVLLENDFKPENTVEFHWYSAEELGLLGSQDIFAEYVEQKIDVRAMLQQDMTGYSAGSKAANDGRDELGVITDFVDPSLTEFIKLLITEYCSIPYVETKCGYACSDHSSASKHGYQSSFVIESAFENSDKKIHTTEDKIEHLDFDHMLEHVKLTLGYALELGNADI